MYKCSLNQQLYTHTHTKMAFKWPPYLEAATGNTCYGKGFERTCKMFMNVLFQECNCFLILNVCWGIRVADTETYSRANKGFTYKMIKDLMGACLHIGIGGTGLCGSWGNGIQAPTNQQNSRASQNLTFPSYKQQLTLSRKSICSLYYEIEFTQYLGPKRHLFSFFFIKSSLRRIHQVNVSFLRVDTTTPGPAPPLSQTGPRPLLHATLDHIED